MTSREVERSKILSRLAAVRPNRRFSVLALLGVDAPYTFKKCKQKYKDASRIIHPDKVPAAMKLHATACFPILRHAFEQTENYALVFQKANGLRNIDHDCEVYATLRYNGICFSSAEPTSSGTRRQPNSARDPPSQGSSSAQAPSARGPPPRGSSSGSSSAKAPPKKKKTKGRSSQSKGAASKRRKTEADAAQREAQRQREETEKAQKERQAQEQREHVEREQEASRAREAETRRAAEESEKAKANERARRAREEEKAQQASDDEQRRQQEEQAAAEEAANARMRYENYTSRNSPENTPDSDETRESDTAGPCNSTEETGDRRARQRQLAKKRSMAMYNRCLEEEKIPSMSWIPPPFNDLQVLPVGHFLPHRYTCEIYARQTSAAFGAQNGLKLAKTKAKVQWKPCLMTPSCVTAEIFLLFLG